MTNAPILLIEDDPDIQANLRLFLELEGFQVESASNGQEALDFLKNNNQVFVILLDLMMPVMNGYQFLEEFFAEQFKELHRIPIIVLSAAADIEGVARRRALQAIRKPIDLDLLLESLRVNRG